MDSGPTGVPPLDLQLLPASSGGLDVVGSINFAQSQFPLVEAAEVTAQVASTLAGQRAQILLERLGELDARVRGSPAYSAAQPRFLQGGLDGGRSRKST